MQAGYENVGRQVCVFVVQKRVAEPRWLHPDGLSTRNQSMKQIPINNGGRPAISEGRRKKYLLSLRLDAEHYFKLKSLARISGHVTAEVLRQLIAAGRVRERLRPEYLDFMSQLKGMARNLNQLTRIAHAKGFMGIVSRHAAIVASIEALLRNLRDDRCKIIAGSSFAGTVGYVMKEQSRVLAAEGITRRMFGR